MRLVTAMVMVGALTWGHDAAAQTDETRFFVSLSGALEPGSQDYADNGTFDLYAEQGRLNVAGDVKTGPVLDFGVGAKVAGNFTLGANFHRTSGTAESTVSGAAPHPVFFSRPRSFSATVADLKRTEQALHLSVGYILPISDRLDVHVFAGPSQFRFTQQVVGGVSVAETANLATPNVATTVATRKDNSWGAHVGADLSYALTGNFRLGGYVRYAGAASEFQVVSNTVSTKIGGVQIGAGLRVRF